MPETPSHIYIVGGTVQAGGGIYIPRRADQDLLSLCRRNAYAYVLTARQIGKSSLMVRTAQHLESEGIQTVIIDLSVIGARASVEEWYFGLIFTLKEQLKLETNINTWWKENIRLAAPQRWSLFLKQVLLVEVTSPIVIFVDEIDTTLKLSFADDFFASIRAFYNVRAQEPEFKRLSFVLIGVATPSDLIRDQTRTPFNIGQRVDLTDFTLEEALPLAKGLTMSPPRAKQVLRWVLEFTQGHPYLTQRLCRVIAERKQDDWTELDVRRTVVETFYDEKSEQDNNLQFVRDMLTKRAPNVTEVLTTYREIRRGRIIVTNGASCPYA